MVAASGQEGAMTENEVAVRCCIAGGGPAGMMLGLLLARAGVPVLVLEKHADFLRDFRGDTIHPSTLEIMHELGLLEDFLRRPHQEARTLGAQIGDDFFEVADFTHLPTHCRFIALMPQWDFLDFIAEKGRRYATFRLEMEAEVTGLIEEGGRVVGVRAATPRGGSSPFAPISWSAPMAAIRPCASRAVSKSTIWARRWTCCGCGCRAIRTIRGRPWAGSTPAGSW